MKHPHQVTYVVMASCLLLSLAANTFAQSNSKGPNSPIVVGKVTAVSADESTLSVKTSDHERTLKVVGATKTTYVGLPDKKDHKFVIGYDVKASVNKDGTAKSIKLTKPVGKPVSLGPSRVGMSPAELFKAADKDRDKRLSYAEYSISIYHSPKHGPDKFHKADKNRNGLLDMSEFEPTLAGVSWWVLSRKSPDQWFQGTDTDSNGKLSIDEFRILASSNHYENHFKRADLDQSDSLDLKEVTLFVRGVTHPTEKKARTRTREKRSKGTSK